MFAAIRYNLANLANFKGRQGRSSFWFYILFLVVIQIAISFVISIAMTGPMMADIFSAAQQGASEGAMQEQMFERLAGMMRASAWTSAVLSLVMCALIVAAFTRRLHDSNKPGWIAALAVLIQLAAIALQVSSIDKAVKVITAARTGDLAGVQEAQASLMINGSLGWVPVLMVIVFGAWPSSDGANRYGPEPDHI
ncbi:DUF805 domain-containing protein [Novosphingobium soli]|uniref:DUF805 domain-containing protein n=1 Tax=Novosphingobium soli TaxID=574956 RepID=A0ABV6CQV0_9SPHN